MKKPSYVLVPGAWLGSWVWSRVTPIINKEGYPAFPVTLTGMGDRVHLATDLLNLETAILDVVNTINYNDLDDIVLIGHSFAGKVVSAVADRIPEKIKSILYLDAFFPSKVRTPQGIFGDEFKTDGFVIPFNEGIIDAIGKDVEGDDRKWLLSKSTPWPVRYAKNPIILSEKFDSIESSYIFCTLSGDPVDEIISGKWGKLYGPYKLIDAGHWPMITKPEETVTDIIELTVD